MPMQKTDDYGNNEDGSQNYTYCKFCYQRGSFTQPNITLEEMIKGNIGIMMKYGMSEEDAKAKVEPLLPTLGRWKK